MKKNLLVAILLILVFAISGCVGIPEEEDSEYGVKRIDSRTQKDLSGYWNDTDVKIIADSLVAECVEAPCIINFIKENQRQPVVQLGSFKNKSDEHLDTEIVATKFKMALINSGKVKFSASKDVKKELREEVLDQQDWANEETAKNLANETAADFLLIGRISTITDSIPGEMIKTYQVVAELYDLESSTVVWSSENMQIKKHVKRSNVRW